jgi:hypothetical protein
LLIEKCGIVLIAEMCAARVGATERFLFNRDSHAVDEPSILTLTLLLLLMVLKRMVMLSLPVYRH